MISCVFFITGKHFDPMQKKTITYRPKSKNENLTFSIGSIPSGSQHPHRMTWLPLFPPPIPPMMTPTPLLPGTLQNQVTVIPRQIMLSVLRGLCSLTFHICKLCKQYNLDGNTQLFIRDIGATQLQCVHGSGGLLSHPFSLDWVIISS